VEILAGEAKGRGKHRGRRASIRLECLPVLVELRIVFAGSPGADHAAHVVFGNPQRVGDRADGRSERDDFTDVQIAIGPAVEPLADARRK
jgi:hypothetical protein